MMLRFAVLGAPIGHSKSPAMHGAAYRALGLDHVYDKLETSADELALRIEELREGRFAGFNITVPHKMHALALVDELDPSAEATGAANTLVRTPDGKIRAYNTDAPALRQEIAALAGGQGESLAGRSALVLGSGGAARAAIFALGELGVSRIVVRARSQASELALATSVPIAFESLDAPPAGESSDLGVIVHATTAGMAGGSVPGSIAADAVAWASAPDDAIAYDVIYTPPVTPFLERARSRGLRSENGLGMLVRQGALAFELWLGIRPPLDVMTRALTA